MRTSDRGKTRATPFHFVAALALALAIGGCQESGRPAAAVSTDDRAPPATAPSSREPQPEKAPVLSFDEAVLSAANNLLTKASLPSAGLSSAKRRALLIDPLVDGQSGVRSVATVSMGTKIAELVRAQYPQFDVQPFSTANLGKAPFILIGTLTAINKQGEPKEPREISRVWLTLLDLESGKVVAKAQARARKEGIDITPTPYFRDSPTWVLDRAMRGYVDACQKSKVGDPINRDYLDQILSSALIGDAIIAYEAGRYQEALGLYLSAQAMPAGDQLRVYNGIYLSNLKLGKREAASEAFGDIVDYGLRTGQLAVKFLFKPGATVFLQDPEVSGPYRAWLKAIAARTSNSNKCLAIKGHTSRTGPEPLNERLSLLRAEYIENRLELEAPPLSTRIIADGVGSRENLVGTGTDDVIDALDRRVEFDVISC